MQRRSMWEASDNLHERKRQKFDLWQNDKGRSSLLKLILQSQKCLKKQMHILNDFMWVTFKGLVRHITKLFKEMFIIRCLNFTEMQY